MKRFGWYSHYINTIVAFVYSVTLDMLSIQGNTGPRWENKIPQLFWRGRDSSRERLKLVEIGRRNPSLFNASLTDFFFFRDEQDVYGPKEKRVSFFEFFRVKFIFYCLGIRTHVFNIYR